MDYDFNDREPTITKIKARLDDLTAQINLLSMDNLNIHEWSIQGMKKPIYVRKYNSSIYEPDEPSAYMMAIDNGWWGDSHATSGPNWGKNIFPNDSKAWWIGDSKTESWRFDKNIPQSEQRFLYYLYDAPEDMMVSIYKLGYWNSLKINGQSVDVEVDPDVKYPGGNATFNLSAGKNVFEITVSGGMPSSGTVLYVSDENNNILFRTGDPGWGVSNTPVPDYTLITDILDNESERDAQNNKILAEIDVIQKMLNGTLIPEGETNTMYKDNATGKLVAQLNELQTTYAELVSELKKPVELEGNYEMSGIKTNAIFSNYMLIVLFTLLLLGALIYIFQNPEVGNLDIFILGLGIVILIYYIYEYIVMKKRQGKK
jgi:hypothetical protein